MPFNMQDRWSNVVYRVKELHKRVKFNDFVNFVKTAAKRATDPTFGNIAINYSNYRSTNQRPHGQRDSKFVMRQRILVRTEIHCKGHCF